MSGKLAIFISTVFISAALLSGAQAAEPPDLGGALFRAVFQSENGTLGNPEKLNLSPAVRPLLDRYVARNAAFRSQLSCAEGASQSDCAKLSGRQRVERAIVTLIDREEIESQASRFAGEIRMLTNWQGMSEGPIEEASSIRDQLGVDSKSPLAPFMYLLLAHRYRAAFEAATQEKQPLVAAQMDALYRHALAQALQSGSPLVALTALDMDRQPFVSTDVRARPAGAGGPSCGNAPSAEPVLEPRAWFPACLLGDPGLASAGPSTLHEFVEDIDHDGKPELFLGSLTERTGGGGPYHVFRRAETGYRQIGTLTIRPKMFKVLPLAADGRPRMTRYWRPAKGDGTLDTLTLDDTGFKVVSSEPLSTVAPGAARLKEVFERTAEAAQPK